MDPVQVREDLRAFITRALIRDASYPLHDDEPIITSGLIDSFALAELAVFVERQWQVYIPDPDLTVERMDTLDQIVARVLAGNAGPC
jgi:acyl carrier protein